METTGLDILKYTNCGLPKVSSYIIVLLRINNNSKEINYYGNNDRFLLKHYALNNS